MKVIIRAILELASKYHTIMPEIKIQDPQKIKKVYFVGIKGVGMTSLAIIAKEAGFEVSGSDVSEEFLTDQVLSRAGIYVDVGFSTSSLEKFIKNSNPAEILIITTAAHDGLHNPQCVFAEKNGIQLLTHGQAVGFFMEGTFLQRTFQSISILGCHGKTTVTAMFAAALKAAGLDPSYAVGTSELFPLGSPGHLGNGKYFVAEADEFISDVSRDHTVKFLYEYPEYAIFNNIDFDHPDVYKDLDDVKKTFEKFAKENLRPGGILFINGDDKNIRDLDLSSLHTVSYGEKDGNTYKIRGFKESGWGSEFEVSTDEKNLGLFTLNVPGYHNAKNSLAVIAFLHVLGIKPDQIKTALNSFQGTKRRQEVVGKTQNGALVIDDYAHHPDEIIKTIDAVKNAYPNKKIVAVFQPHTLSRTVSLQNAFSQAFEGADSVLFLPIFTSKREGNVDYQNIYTELENSIKNTGVDVHFLKDERESSEKEESPYAIKKYRSIVVQYILGKFDSEDFVIVTLGAGDLYKIAYDLIGE